MTAQLEILENAIERELRVANLYEAFAGQFLSEEGIWHGLARIEHVHVTMLRQLAHHIKQNSCIVWNLGQLKHENFLEDYELLVASEWGLSVGQMVVDNALRVTERLENSMFHSKFYEIVNCDLPYFKGMSTGLRRAGIQYVEQLKESIAVSLNACA